MKIKRILALTAVVLLVGLYAAAFVFALMDSEWAQSMFRAALGATILVPVFSYLVILVARSVRPTKSAVVDAVVFDIGRVLADWSWEEHCAQIGIPEETIRVISEKVVHQPIWGEYDLGLRGREEITSEIVKRIPGYEKEFRSFIDTMDSCIQPFWYTEDLIAGLKRKGYRVFFLSNWNRECKEYCDAHHTLDFTKRMDGGIWSFEAHLIKPDHSIFRLLSERYKLKPERTVFLDDTEANIRAARECGYLGIVFTSYAEAMEQLSAIGVKLS